MMDLCIQDSKKKCVRHGIWKLRVHTFQPQNLLSDHLSILTQVARIRFPPPASYFFNLRENFFGKTGVWGRSPGQGTFFDIQVKKQQICSEISSIFKRVNLRKFFNRRNLMLRKKILIGADIDSAAKYGRNERQFWRAWLFGLLNWVRLHFFSDIPCQLVIRLTINGGSGAGPPENVRTS